MSQSNTEAQNFTKKATTLRNEGRIEEALLSARKATSLDPEDPNAWWQLALCQEQKEGLAASINSLKKTVEFAPSFAGGWCQLGLAYKKTSMLDKAIECYERALEEDESHVRTLKLLETALADRDFAQDKNSRIRILGTLNELEELDATTSFSYAYLLSEQKDYLAAIKIYALCTQISSSPKGSYNNLAHSFEQLGRDLDAIDAYRKSYSLDESYELPKNNILKILPKLIKLREKVILKSPYLDLENSFKHYINPFELLGLDDPNEIEGDTKIFQKYKQALYREIELEDGKVDWISGLSIDKSKAMVICEQLSDPIQFKYHKAIFENKALCGFLSRGNLEHFLVDPEPAQPVILVHELDQDMLAWLGGYFAEQYNIVFSKAIDNGDLEVIECMLDGRRWILAEHEDRCFEGALRVIERMIDPLEKLANSAKENIKFRLTDVQNVLNNKNLQKILRLLPAEFSEIHATVYRALRSLSIGMYNSHSEPETALAIIELGRFITEKSPVIAHQFEEDIKALQDKIKEEKANEAHLTFGNKTLDITKDGVAYDGKKISTNDITAARWGMVVTSNTPRTISFTIAFKDRFNTDINVTWSSSKVEEQKKLWRNLVDATIHYLLDDLIKNFNQRLDAGIKTLVGPLLITSSGVEFEVDGWFSKKKIFCPWRRLSTEIDNGSLIVKDSSDNKASVQLSLETVDNAFVLHFIASQKS